jgi:hypothetical protein
MTEHRPPHRSHAVHVGLVLLTLALSACHWGVAVQTLTKVGGQPADPAGHVAIAREGKALVARRQMLLQKGDTVTTDANTTTVLRYPSGAFATLWERTKATLDPLTIWFGRVFIGGWLHGKSELVSAAVPGTHYVLDVDAASGVHSVSVLEGRVQVSSSKGAFPPILLTDGQRVRVTAGQQRPPEMDTLTRAEYNTLVEQMNAAGDPSLEAALTLDVMGETADDAVARMESMGVAVRRIARITPQPQAVGRVVGQDPLPGHPGRPSREVELRIGRLYDPVGDAVELTTPPEGEAGSGLELRWTGPNAADDALVLAPLGTPDEVAADTRRISAVAGEGMLRLPREPGPYELRYVRDGAVVARAPVVVRPVRVTLNAPASAQGGDTLMLTWAGPNHGHDSVRVVKAGAPDNAGSLSPTLAARHGKGQVVVPSAPGEYEIRYVEERLTGRAATVLARSRITVTSAPAAPSPQPASNPTPPPAPEPLAATIAAPTRVQAGETFGLKWYGPNRPRDRVVLARKNGQDIVVKGSPQELGATSGHGTLRAPSEPGLYELRYIALAADDLGRSSVAGPNVPSIIASHTLEVVPSIHLEAEKYCWPDYPIEVTVVGPRSAGDSLCIFARASSDAAPLACVDVTAGKMTVQVPNVEGPLDLRYRLGSTGSLVARTALEVYVDPPCLK